MTGGCCCGFIRYETAGEPRHETICHCSVCRRTSAAAGVAWFTVSAGDFRITSGEPARFASSDHGVRSFCPRCGTPLTFVSTRSPGEVDVTTCSLDDPELAPPRDHTHTASRLSWSALDDRLPRFAHGRE